LARDATPKELVFYTDEASYEPFQDWIYRLRDEQGRRRIFKRLKRLEFGNYGDVEPIGEGLSELRLFFGPGYRVYFGEIANTVVVILCGGSNSKFRILTK
jgi:putative addiction module killer protein